MPPYLMPYRPDAKGGDRLVKPKGIFDEEMLRILLTAVIC